MFTKSSASRKRKAVTERRANDSDKQENVVLSSYASPLGFISSFQSSLALLPHEGGECSDDENSSSNINDRSNKKTKHEHKNEKDLKKVLACKRTCGGADADIVIVTPDDVLDALHTIFPDVLIQIVSLYLFTSPYKPCQPIDRMLTRLTTFVIGMSPHNNLPLYYSLRGCNFDTLSTIINTDTQSLKTKMWCETKRALRPNAKQFEVWLFVCGFHPLFLTFWFLLF